MTGSPDPAAGQQLLVIDTNIVLDLLVFRDPATTDLRDALDAGNWSWLASTRMRDELSRVLAYPQLQPWMQRHALQQADVLAQFDRMCRIVAQPPVIGPRCSDPDDQPFIDLAAWHRATLLSKDHAVTRLRKRMAALGVAVHARFNAPP